MELLGRLTLEAMRCSSRKSPLVVLCVVLATAIFCSRVSAQCSTTFTLLNGTEHTYSFCQNLGVQNATLAWDWYPPSDNATGGVMDLAYTNTLLSPKGWVGWGINPTQSAMDGSSVLVAFIDSSAGGIVLPYYLPTALVGNNPPTLVSSESAPFDFTVLDSSVDINTGTLEVTIYATLQLQPNETNVYQVWNKGPSVTGRSPNEHYTTTNYIASVGGLDVVNGSVSAGDTGTPPIQNIHGVLNAISWGILFPVGIMAARYMKPFRIFNPVWFYVHVFCQVCGYILAVAGWATGMKIASTSDTVDNEHRNIGIAMFVFATVQVLALFIRPSPKRKLRKAWNVYHHTFGYVILILSIINIFRGFDLLLPPEDWKRAYIGIIISLAGIALLSEFVTWTVWVRRMLKKRREMKDQKPAGGAQKPKSVDKV